MAKKNFTPGPLAEAAYARETPFRKPGWRIARVRHLLKQESGRTDWRIDDPDLCEAFHFFKKKREIRRTYRDKKDRNNVMYSELYMQNPGLFAAMRIHGDPKRQVSSVLEARILSGQTNEDIARRTPIAAATSHWYESIFYNVRERLKYVDYVHQIVLPDAHENKRIGNISRELALKLLGYNHGPVVLETLVTACDQGSIQPGYGASLVDYMCAMYDFLVIQRSQHTIQFAEINEYNMRTLFEEQSRVRALRQQMQGAGGGHASSDVLILKAVQQALGLRFGESTAKQVTDLRSPYAGSAAELRASELQQLSRGEQPLPPDEFSKFTMPKPKKKRAGEKDDADN